MSHTATLKTINLILWEHWDPIGCGVPQDEYASYAPGVYSFLAGRPTRDALADYLQGLAASLLSSPIERARAERVADLLLPVKLGK